MVRVLLGLPGIASSLPGLCALGPGTRGVGGVGLAGGGAVMAGVLQKWELNQPHMKNMIQLGKMGILYWNYWMCLKMCNQTMGNLNLSENVGLCWVKTPRHPLVNHYVL